MAKLQNVTTVNMVNGEITAIKYGGAVYAKVADKAMLSDIVRTMNGAKDVTTGAYYSVSVPDENGDVAIRDDVYDKRSSLGRFDVFRKASASAPFAEMVVSRVEAVEKRMDALEGAKDPETLVKGDRVLISGRSIYKALDFGGKFGKIVKVDYDGEHLVSFGGESEYYFHREQLTKVAGTVAPAKPKSGDIVVITANTNGSRNKVGDVGKVEDLRPHSARVSVAGRGNHSNWTDNSEMRLATPAEIAKYEASLVQIAKDSVFTKAGRKPNEYREGDVVRVIDTMRTIYLDIGQITEVINPQSIGGQDVRSNDGGTRYAKVEVVCFAESRADLAKWAC